MLRPAPSGPLLLRPPTDAAPPAAEPVREGRLRRLAGRPELLGLLVLAALLNLWSLDTNGWANEYYSAAVRSMTQSWHNFLFASFDPSGVMTVDKPPLALWVQALSARIFGFSSLSILVPQALMGIASVGLTYDLVRRRFGRTGGFAAGLALAVTPVAVAIFRHNNPDALLVLCAVGALWAIVRGLEDGRTRWLLLCGALVGLGFETKMGAALLVAPAFAAAYLWMAPRGRVAALRRLLAGGAALLVTGLAWPVLVWLTPAADRPFVSGTDDNSIWSLILGYNGLGRLAGQAGGPAGRAGGGPGGGFGGTSLFGGETGPLRLVDEALGTQAGWLLGVAAVGAAGLVVATRLRREDARTGWLIATGGAFLTTGVAFSYASGIFHPYYVSLMAPFTAALVGATTAEMLRGGRAARVLAPAAIAAGVLVELAAIGDAGNLDWLGPVLVVAGVASAATIAVAADARIRAAAVALFLAAALTGPAIWSVQTLGHATNGTFPAGGPAAVGFGGPGGGGPGGGGLRGGPVGPSAAPGGGRMAPPQAGDGGFGPGRRGGFGGGGPGGGGMFGGTSNLRRVLAYTRSHGGGTVAVAGQSGASSAIIDSDASVAGIGGFSGRESTPSLAWFAQKVRDGDIRWVLTGGEMGGFRDGREGATDVMTAVAGVCTPTPTSGLYDCRGKGDALAGAAS